MDREGSGGISGGISGFIAEVRVGPDGGAGLLSISGKLAQTKIIKKIIIKN
jgi:hypothetical protein